MKKIIGIVGGLAFFLALGIVGAVEHGAELSRMLWLMPLIAVMGICVKLENRKEF